ncbi:hypothetical protein [Candidatus Marithrix sp. Canyon 246]|nr:hypothetical protein [Candidatus Marithrix sp. Canyon 246]
MYEIRTTPEFDSWLDNLRGDKASQKKDIKKAKAILADIEDQL